MEKIFLLVERHFGTRFTNNSALICLKTLSEESRQPIKDAIEKCLGYFNGNNAKVLDDGVSKLLKKETWKLEDGDYMYYIKEIELY